MRIRGVPLRLHWSFLLFFALIAGLMYIARYETPVIAYVIGLVAAMFFFVLLHELAHVATARYYDVPTRAITLHPLGGVSMLERVPERPGQEALVAFSGPLVNLALALLFLPLAIALYGPGRLLHAPQLLEPAGWALDLLWINLLLGVFNLLPAFPLDGGRVLRATLAIRIPYARATRAAAFVGRTIAIAFVVLGLFWNWLFVLIGIFVFFGAAMEDRSAQLMQLFARIQIQDTLRTDTPTVPPHATLEEVTALRDPDHPLPVAVVENDELHGLIDVETLRYLQPRTDRDAASVMRTKIPTVESDQDLSAALRQFIGGRHEAIPVVEPIIKRPGDQEAPRPRFVGLITTQEMETAYQKLRREALAKRGRRRKRRRGGPPMATETRILREEPPPDAEKWVPEGSKP